MPAVAASAMAMAMLPITRLTGSWSALTSRALPAGSTDRATPVVDLTMADAVTLVVLQLRHSWRSRYVARPRGWPATLLLQAVLTYALFPATGWHSMTMCGFLAGSALLLVPAAPGRVGFAAVIASLPVLWAVRPVCTLTPTGWQYEPIRAASRRRRPARASSATGTWPSRSQPVTRGCR